MFRSRTGLFRSTTRPSTIPRLPEHSVPQSSQHCRRRKIRSSGTISWPTIIGHWTVLVRLFPFHWMEPLLPHRASDQPRRHLHPTLQPFAQKENSDEEDDGMPVLLEHGRTTGKGRFSRLIATSPLFKQPGSFGSVALCSQDRESNHGSLPL